jgi:ubiquinone/menaquinone biosynthesis C-methylase UbiE
VEQSDYGRHFGELAGRYDELRKDPSDENIAALVRAGDLSRRRVLDVGCGTGRPAAALAERYGASVVGIDPSEKMLEVARRSAPADVELIRAPAEALPFRDGSFGRAMMQLVVHLIDRPRAFLETRRVLEPGGRLVICTLDPSSIEQIWLSKLFPSYASIDRSRFPLPEKLARELEAAGFEGVGRAVPFEEWVSYPRELALAMLRGRFASSFALIAETEYRLGLERAERELPELVEFVLRLLIIVARR